MTKNHIAKYWHINPDGRTQCDLCPRFCNLNEGQRGFCFVRKRENDSIILTTYGRSSGFCIDPVEKKPLNHFYPGSSILSFGTAGCNLGCKFCQNWHMSKSREMDRLADFASPEMIAKAAKQKGCRSVAFTYNDPVIFAEYAIDISRECRAEGIKTAAVTAGYITPEAAVDFFGAMDAANVDLKAFNDKFYKKLCLGSIEPVLETLKYIRNETSVWLEITTLLIPGENDSENELNELASWIRDELGPDVPLHFTAFHPDFKLKNKPFTSKSILSNARRIARANGLNYVYTGNVVDVDGGSTFCPSCNELVIERDWYNLGKYNLDKNKCSNCRTEIAGHFDDSHENWGGRRAPIRIV